MKYMNIVFILLILCSCNKDGVYTPVKTQCIYNCDTPRYQVVWQAPIFIDSSSNECTIPYLNGNIILIPHDPVSYSEPGNAILAGFNKNTGKRIFDWNSYSHIKGASVTSNSVSQIKDKIILNPTDDQNIFAIDFSTGKTVWSTTIVDGSGFPRISSFGDFVYQIRNKNNQRENYLMRANINSGVWDTIYKVVNNDKRLDIEPPYGWINPDKDTVLIFQNRYVSQTYGGGDGLDIYAYNLNKKKEEFILRNIDFYGSATSVEPPVISNNKLYFMGTRIVYCINLLTGIIEWQKEFHDSFSFGSLVIAEEKLFVKTDNESLYAINLQDGNIIWQSTGDYGSSCSPMVYYNGYLYYTGAVKSGGLFVIDAASGKIIWNVRSINEFATPLNNFKVRGSSFSRGFGIGGVTIDPEQNCMFVSDNCYLMCIKLPK